MTYFVIYIIIYFIADRVLGKTLYVLLQETIPPVIGLKRFYDSLAESVDEWNNNPKLSNKCRILCFSGNFNYSEVIEFANNPDNIIWCLLWHGILNRNMYHGPFTVPSSYLKFPSKKYEHKWYFYLSEMKGYVVHTKRVRNHLIRRSNTYSLLHNYIIVPNCMKYEPVVNNSIINWDNRSYDILLYLKYADLNKTNGGKILYHELIKEYKIKVLEYYYYKRDEIFEYGNKSKFVIYFSFYDTYPSALLELQSMGVFTITLQDEFVDENNGVFMPELEYNLTEAIERIRKITKKKYDSVYLANYNRKKYDCINSFKKFLDQVI